MIKTPLPIKDTAPEGTTFTSLGQNERKINEIITYLAELTDVVEGFNKPFYTVNENFKWEEELKPGSIRRLVPTPTLKEQLLEEIKTMQRIVGAPRWVHIEDVEAIINKLMR